MLGGHVSVTLKRRYSDGVVRTTGLALGRPRHASLPVVSILPTTYSRYPVSTCCIASVYHRYVARGYVGGYPGGTVDVVRSHTFVSGAGYVRYNHYGRVYPCNTVVRVRHPYIHTYTVNTVDVNRGHGTIVSRRGYISYNTYHGTYPFNTVSRHDGVVHIVHRVRRNGRIVTLITPSVMNRCKLGVAVTRVCRTLRGTNFTRIMRININTSVADIGRTRRCLRGIPTGRNFVADSYYPTFIGLVGARMPRTTSGVSSAPSPVLAYTRLVGRGCPCTIAIFVNPYVTGGIRTHRRHRAVGCILAFRRVVYVLRNGSVGFTRVDNSATCRHSTSGLNLDFPLATNMDTTIRSAITTVNNRIRGTRSYSNLSGYHSAIGTTTTNGLSYDCVRNVTYSGNYVSNPTTMNSFRVAGITLAGCTTTTPGGRTTRSGRAGWGFAGCPFYHVNEKSDLFVTKF